TVLAAQPIAFRRRLPVRRLLRVAKRLGAPVSPAPPLPCDLLPAQQGARPMHLGHHVHRTGYRDPPQRRPGTHRRAPSPSCSALAARSRSTPYTLPHPTDRAAAPLRLIICSVRLSEILVHECLPLKCRAEPGRSLLTFPTYHSGPR